MSQSPYVTVREASQMLGIAEGKVMGLVEDKKLMAYRIADQYLRLKRSDILSLRDSGSVESETIKFAYTPQERLMDLLRYNDFYIASFLVILILLSLVFFVH